MLAKRDHIIVEADPAQKETVVIAGTELLSGSRYNQNFRESGTVLAKVLSGQGNIKTGDWIVTDYSFFDESSPFLISHNQYAIPLGSEIYAVLDCEGNPQPVCGNVIVKRVEKESYLLLPEDLKQEYHDRGIVVSNSSGFRVGQMVLFMTFSDWEICFTWNGVERRFIKIGSDEIVGVVGK